MIEFQSSHSVIPIVCFVIAGVMLLFALVVYIIGILRYPIPDFPLSWLSPEGQREVFENLENKKRSESIAGILFIVMLFFFLFGISKHDYDYKDIDTWIEKTHVAVYDKSSNDLEERIIDACESSNDVTLIQVFNTETNQKQEVKVLPTGKVCQIEVIDEE